MQDRIRIGSRKSKLALIQTEIVKAQIEKAFPGIVVEVVKMSTKGDELLDRSLTSFGGKGVFTKELEEALLRKEIDLAVHSAKDMPMEFPQRAWNWSGTKKRSRRRCCGDTRWDGASGIKGRQCGGHKQSSQGVAD